MEGLLLHIISQDCSFLSVHGVQGSFPYFKGALSWRVPHLLVKVELTL